MGAAWSFRLAGYLVIDRIIRAGEEDGRYRMLRAQWGARAQGRFFHLFQGQALLVVLFGLPFVAVASKAVDLIDDGGDLVRGEDGGTHQEAGEVEAEAFFFGHGHVISPGKRFSGGIRTVRLFFGIEGQRALGGAGGRFEIRVNDRWRICFVWRDGETWHVEIVDYH